MSYCIGVDLGTTSVRAAVCDEEGVRVVALGDRAADTPSAVYLQHDGTLITGRRAASKSVTNPGRVARQFTRLLGSPESVIIGGQPFTPSELLGVLLGNVVHHVTTLEGSPPDAAVLTHPVGWGSAQLELLREVAVGVGLADPVLVSAPTAVAAHWASSRDASSRDGADATVAVYDLGGGTFDAAVVRGPDMSVADGSVGRDLGGMDFDELLVGLIDSSLGGAVSSLAASDAASDPSNATALARIRQDCIRAKEALSGVPEAYVPVFLPGRHTDVRVRRDDLEKLVTTQIASTADEFAGALTSAGVDARDLAAVLLVGGSARIPLVARTVSERLGRVVTVEDDSACAAAAGAAMIGGTARGWLVRAGGPAVSGETATEDAASTSGAAPAGSTPPASPTPDPMTSGAGRPRRPTGPSSWVPPPRRPSPHALANFGTPSPAAANPILPDSGSPDSGPPNLARPANGRAPTPSPPPPPREPSRAGHPTVDPRLRRYVTMGGGALAVVVIALWLLQPWQRQAPLPALSDATLVLTTNTVRVTEAYYAYASGFEPGEPVEVSRKGPTSGVVGTAIEADAAGAVKQGPIKESDLPGAYQIVARGLQSGRTATARLDVLPSRSAN